MQAFYAKTIEDIKEYLDVVGADMEIINFNIRESNMSEKQKNENIELISKLREDIYNTAKQLKSNQREKENNPIDGLLDFYTERT